MLFNSKKLRGLAALLSLASFACIASCATIINGTSQKIRISTKPRGAAVTIDNKTYGKTPLLAKLSRKDEHMVKIEMEGYQPFETTISRGTSGWVWGNILFGGLIGLAIDAISGGMYKLDPQQLSETLDKQEVGIIPAEDAIYVTIVMTPNPSWQKIGALQANPAP